MRIYYWRDGSATSITNSKTYIQRTCQTIPWNNTDCRKKSQANRCCFWHLHNKIQLKILKEIEGPKEVCNYSKLFLQVLSNNGILYFLQITKTNLLVFLSRNGKNCMIRLGVKRFIVTARKKPSELHLKAQEEKKR